jgi:uncharacterized membrane-anchored protein
MRKDLSMNVPGMAALADGLRKLNDGVDCLAKRMDALRGDSSKEFHDLVSSHSQKTAQKALEAGDHKMAEKWVNYGTEHAKQAEDKAERMAGPPEDKKKDSKKK